MATIYQNPSLKEHPVQPGAQETGYTKYVEPDTTVPPKAKPVTREVSVNGVVVPEEIILAEAQNHPADTPGEAVRLAVKALVVRELLVQEARRRNVSAEPELDQDGRSETEEDALIRALTDQEINVPKASEEECRRYYELNREKFTTGPLFEARHILLAARSDDSDARQKAFDRGREFCNLLANDPSVFSELAAAYSACSSKDEGGRLGQVARGETVPAFESALEALHEGEIVSEPVETEFGFHVIVLDRRIEGREIPFEHARERIAAWLEASSWTKAVAQYIAILSADAEISGISMDAADGPLVQ
ncbi:MAG: peptidylprolyl isomerase [Roseibium sp.]|uniref:peptidylprolyl isomerase n=1 Tax=Roseibium sp. TaxID=1936156 RepID=UPI002630ABD8|nr:peptidylprolyl isomerase [Roseibium sp.]MCV0425677.1 peptidylprolyl isomerase [Roseibium sp.]